MMLALNIFLYSQDRAESYPNIGLVTSMAFLLSPNEKYSAHLTSAAHQSIFKCMSAIFFVNLLRFCDCSRSSTSIVLRIGSICSHKLAYIQVLFDSQCIFSTSCCFDDWKTQFCKILQLPQPTWVL